MNPAALKQSYKFLKPGGVIIVDIDSFKEDGLKKAKFATDDPIKELGITAQVVEVPVTTMTKAALADSGMDNKAVLKCRNIFTLGLLCWLFDRPEEGARKMLQDKFAKNRRLRGQCQGAPCRFMITDTIYMPRFRPTVSIRTKSAQACTRI